MRLLEAIIKVWGRAFCILQSFFAQIDFAARVITQLLKYFIVFIPPMWPYCSWNILGMHRNILNTPSSFYLHSSTFPCGFPPPFFFSRPLMKGYFVKEFILELFVLVFYIEYSFVSLPSSYYFALIFLIALI